MLPASVVVVPLAVGFFLFFFFLPVVEEVRFGHNGFGRLDVAKFEYKVSHANVS